MCALSQQLADDTKQSVMMDEDVHWVGGCTIALDKLLAPVCLCDLTVYVGTNEGVISLAGKVTAGLVESNGSLPPGLWPMSSVSWLRRNRDQLRAQLS